MGLVLPYTEILTLSIHRRVLTVSKLVRLGNGHLCAGYFLLFCIPAVCLYVTLLLLGWRSFNFNFFVSLV